MLYMNKDLDIAKIIQKLRVVNYFMKMQLDIDQRKLLKMRSSKLITSDIETKFPEHQFRKTVDDQEIYNVFVDNIRQKKIDKKDVKLLQITGLD